MSDWRRYHEVLANVRWLDRMGLLGHSAGVLMVNELCRMRDALEVWEGVAS